MRHNESKKLSVKDILIPKIPRVFIENAPICQVLYTTIEEFNFEEKTVIYQYCFVKLSVDEIAELTELSNLYVISTLTLFSERLAFKLGVFKNAITYSTNDMVSVQEMFELEPVKEMLEEEFSKCYMKWQVENHYFVM